MQADLLLQRDRTEQQVVGRQHWEIWPELLGSDPKQLYRRAMQTRQPGTTEFEYSYPHESSVWIEVQVYPATDGGLAVLFRDETSRKEAEEKLRDADRRKDEFLAMLAPELGNPSARIRAAADLLQLTKMNEARIRKTS